jgi:hypothetical protein
MTNFAQDSFAGINGADLNSRNDDLGNSWSRAGGTANAAVLDTSTSPNSARGNGLGSLAYYKNSGTPASADYTVQATIFVKGATTSTAVSMLGRVSTNSTADDTYYQASATYNGSAQAAVQLFKKIAGVVTQLGSDFLHTWASGDVIKLVMSGTTIKVNLNGTDVITVTDSAIAAAGFSGVRLNASSSDGLWVQSFSAFSAVDSHVPYNPWPLWGPLLAQ